MHVKNRTGHMWEGPEANANRHLAGGKRKALTIADATHVIKKGRVVRALDLFHLRVYVGSFRLFIPGSPFPSSLSEN